MIHDPGPWHSPAGVPTGPRDDRRRPAPVVACSLCGIQLPAHQMVPDGGQACADIRWYCRDAKSCTDRWTARPARPGPIAAAQDAPSAEPRSHRLPAAWLGGPPEVE